MILIYSDFILNASVYFAQWFDMATTPVKKSTGRA